MIDNKEEIPPKMESKSNNASTNITNNFMMFSEDLKLRLAKEVLNSMGISNLIVDEQNSTIYLNPKK